MHYCSARAFISAHFIRRVIETPLPAWRLVYVTIGKNAVSRYDIDADAKSDTGKNTHAGKKKNAYTQTLCNDRRVTHGNIELTCK